MYNHQDVYKRQELFYCLSGEGQLYLAGQLFPVKPDDMVIVNPQVEHTELSLNASPLEYIVPVSYTHLSRKCIPGFLFCRL